MKCAYIKYNLLPKVDFTEFAFTEMFANAEIVLTKVVVKEEMSRCQRIT